MTKLIAIFGLSISVHLAAQSVQTPAGSPVAAANSVIITLDEALARAQTNEPAFAAASAASRNANLDRSIARAALLPNVIYHNQFLYTQPLHGPSSSENASAGSAGISGTPRFIGNNSVHEYFSQGVVTETIGAQQFNAVSRASTSAALANAEFEIASRGLHATVVSLFYGSLTADHRLAIAQRAAAEANSFTILTQQREAAREVAHADVVRAQLQQQQRTRDLADAQLQADKARLELGVLLFSDPRSPYALNTPALPATPPARADVDAALLRRNPELQSALATSRLADLSLSSARLAYLPDLGLNYNYGIDAAQFATHGPDGSRNLGYSASVTLDIPVWDWFTTQNKIRQSRISQNAARVTLTNTQRHLVAQLEEVYAEAVASHDQLSSLDDSVNTATESLRLTRLRYTAGEATVLEVVDAQSSLVVAELAREDGIVRYQTALANLQLLTGTL